MTLSVRLPPVPMTPTKTKPNGDRSQKWRIGHYLPTLIILGVAVPALIYMAIMEMLGWPVPSVGIQKAFSRVVSSSDRVFLYAPPANQAYFSKIGGSHETLLLPWRNYFQDRKRNFSEIRDVSTLTAVQGGVLILPSVVALDEDERAAIAAFRARGGSILSTWATGTRNSKGDWVGWQFLEGLGAKMVGEIPADADVRQLVLNGESPVSHSLPAGQRTWMGKTAEPLLRFKGDMVAGRFMNWARLVDDERRGEGAVVFTETAANATTASSRVAVYSFAETAWESHPLITYRLIDDTLKWLQREPAIVLAAWPDGKRAAQVIEMDTEEGFPDALSFASMMRAINYRATFYVLTSVGKQFPDVLKNLAADFEVGYHGDVHEGFKGQPITIQERRLLTMRQEMSSVLNDAKPITGFRAPTESYDGTTEQLLQKAGIRHHAADPDRSEGRLPVFAKLEGVDPENGLVVLPRTQRDDINLAQQSLSAEQISKALIDDFDLVIDSGALGWLSVHSQNFKVDGALIKAMPSYLAHLNRSRNSLWLASAGQVADWWRERERFKLSSSYSGNRLLFDITVKGEKPLSGASMILMLPNKGSLPTVRGVKTDMAAPVVSRIDDYRASIVFESLRPGNYAYQATFQSP